MNVQQCAGQSSRRVQPPLEVHPSMSLSGGSDISDAPISELQPDERSLQGVDTAVSAEKRLNRGVISR